MSTIETATTAAETAATARQQLTQLQGRLRETQRTLTRLEQEKVESESAELADAAKALLDGQQTLPRPKPMRVAREIERGRYEAQALEQALELARREIQVAEQADDAQTAEALLPSYSNVVRQVCVAVDALSEALLAHAREVEVLKRAGAVGGMYGLRVLDANVFSKEWKEVGQRFQRQAIASGFIEPPPQQPSAPRPEPKRQEPDDNAAAPPVEFDPSYWDGSQPSNVKPPEPIEWGENFWTGDTHVVSSGEPTAP